MKRNLVGKILGKIKIFVQDFVPIRTGNGKWGQRKHMSPSSEETPGHTGQELRVSLELLSLTVLRFVVAHLRPTDYATCTYLLHICRRDTE